MKYLLESLLEGSNLTREEAGDGVEQIISGADPCQAAAFLALLKAKGETPQEVAGMVTTMRRHMVRVEPGCPTIDIVGTGGDGHHTVNVSTAASIVMAACGAKVAKHGNRSVSSQCGSADVLEELGVTLNLPAAAIERCVQKAGISFMFAPAFHPAMKNIVPVRKALGVRTIFNILGPLLNPAECSRQLIGVYSVPMVKLMADVLYELGVDHSLVVHCGGERFHARRRYVVGCDGRSGLIWVSIWFSAGILNGPGGHSLACHHFLAQVWMSWRRLPLLTWRG